jgi:dihydrofolate reductase
MFITLSLDGYFEGLNHDISWHRVDDEGNKFIIEEFKGIDLIIFGRRSYQLMEGFWPDAVNDPKMSEEDHVVGRFINNTNKMVFSRTLDKVEEKENWKNVALVKKFDPEEIKRIKQQPGKDIWVGGSDLATSFVKYGLIDEFKFMVDPVVVGAGTQIFKGIEKRLNLELIKTHVFKNGNVLLCYRPA